MDEKQRWKFQLANWRDCTQENLYMSPKGKSKERKWISFKYYAKRLHKDQLWLRKIDYTQQNNKCWFYSHADETGNHISECSKIVQKEYKTMFDWVRKVIYWELCKGLKFDHNTTWNMYNPEYVLETLKIHSDFEIQTDRQILNRRQDQVPINKKKKNERICRLVEFSILVNQRVKKNWQILGFYQKTKKKLWNMRVTVIPNCPQETGGNGNQRENRDQSDDTIAEIGQNTQESPLNLSWLTLTSEGKPAYAGGVNMPRVK